MLRKIKESGLKEIVSYIGMKTKCAPQHYANIAKRKLPFHWLTKEFISMLSIMKKKS